LRVQQTFGEVEAAYQEEYSQKRYDKERHAVVVRYIHDFPEEAPYSDWVQGEILRMWRMGDRDSLRALQRAIHHRLNPRPFRKRIGRVMAEVRLRIYSKTLPELVSFYRKIKGWIRARRQGVLPRPTRGNLWEEWQAQHPGSQDAPIDRKHFFMLASSDMRYYTPAYVARSYLRRFLRLPDRMVANVYAQSRSRALRIPNSTSENPRRP
jgi:hypothetical protein